MEALLKCANGDGNPVCPPSKVICRQCMDKIISNLEEYIIDLQQQKIKESNYALCSYKHNCEFQKIKLLETITCENHDYDCLYKQYV